MAVPTPLHSYRPGRPHWWQWLTVLSLDAPLVAMAWQAAFARALRVDLGWPQEFVLGSSVWLAYVADRWIEGWRLVPSQVRTQRHWFYQRWRWPVAAAWLGLLAAAVTLSLTRLARAELQAGLWVLAPVLVYLLSHQLVHRHHAWRAPKELCVALLFTAGAACFPTAGRLPALARLAVPLLFFGLLCFTDCALISLWENEVDRAHGQTSLALQFPRGRSLVRAGPWLAVGLGILMARQVSGELAGLMWCSVASGALLGGLDLAHRRLGRQLARALADVSLLTPFILLFPTGPG